MHLMWWTMPVVQSQEEEGRFMTSVGHLIPLYISNS